jgi:hypothetical protein
MKTKSIVAFGVFLLVLMATPAFAGVTPITRYVGCDFTWSYNEIQDAVDAANPYDTIIVCPKPWGGCYAPVGIFDNRDGLTIESTEIPDCGPNTCVASFTIGFASHSDHPEHVTIKGFNVTPCKANGVGIEISTDYNTIAFNHVHGCHETEGPGSGGEIRVNRGNDGNNIHHNLVDDCSFEGDAWNPQSSTSGIYAEEDGGANQNIHQNCVEGCLENGIWLGSNYSEVHQNQILDYILRGIRISGDGNQVHHNDVCDGTHDSINLDNHTYNNYIHHNILTGKVTGSTAHDRIRMNDTYADCPIDELTCCNGDAVPED